MRLFAIPGQSGDEEARAEREAGLWWAVARREEPGANTSPERRAMTELSEAVREANLHIDATAGLDARECFSATHRRLMQAIAASTPLPGETAPCEITVPSSGGRQPFQTWKLPAQWGKLPSSGRRLLSAPLLMQSSALTACVLAGILLGRHSANQEAPFLPVTDIVADYDRRAANSELPENAHGQDAKRIAVSLSNQVGLRVKLPQPEKMGAHLVGVRTAEYDGVPTVEANFLKDGNSVAFFQAKAPQRSLRFVQEKRVGDKVFMLRDLGKYRVVAWRNDESVLALVSSLNSDQSLTLASAMRDAAVGDETAA